jgi:hypothetical protein
MSKTWDEMAQEYGPGYAEHKARCEALGLPPIWVVGNTIYFLSHTQQPGPPAADVTQTGGNSTEGTWRTRPPAWMAQ